jgi:hypothetical protein
MLGSWSFPALSVDGCGVAGTVQALASGVAFS